MAAWEISQEGLSVLNARPYVAVAGGNCRGGSQGGNACCKGQCTG